MKLSLSVRIAEAACKTKLNLPVDEIIRIAAETGYEAVCMRASAAGVQTPRDELAKIRKSVEQAGLVVSMVTADFDVPLNNANGPTALRDIGPSLDVAESLGCDLVRVCMKKPDDIPHARLAAERAGQRGIRLAHQCHTASLFEQVDPMLQVLEQIGQPNFGLIYEPANLMLCGQPYGLETLQRLAPHLMNVYVQNHRLDVAGPVSLETFCRGEVRFHHLPLWEAGGVDYAAVFQALQAVSYDGYFTIHQAQGIRTLDDAQDYARRCAEFFRRNVAGLH